MDSGPSGDARFFLSPRFTVAVPTVKPDQVPTLIGDVIGQRGQALERIQAQGAIRTRRFSEGAVLRGGGPCGMENHATGLLVVDALEGHWRMKPCRWPASPGPRYRQTGWLDPGRRKTRDAENGPGFRRSSR